LEAPLLVLDGDRVVVRRLAPPDTLGGGVVLDARARRHGRRPQALARLRAMRDGSLPRGEADGERGALQARAPEARAPARNVDARTLQELERDLRGAGTAMLSESQVAGRAAALRALREQGRAVRVSGRLYAHADVMREMRERILGLIARDGSATLGGVRDALGVSRKSAQAFLEHLDGARLTRRLADDRRVLAGRSSRPAGGGG
jgi:selenocysteine-specific elongation factor